MSTASPGPRRTRQRSVVQRELADRDEFVSAQELHKRLISRGTVVGLSTVYRSLRGLERSGHVDMVRDEATGERLYRTRSAAGHRHYVLCRRCGRSEPVNADVVEEWVRRLTEQVDFFDIDHTLELSGRCKECRR
ncbi:Fur family transcriptional regulator [Streptomyces reniochalinae]|uniref:Transcriptional repressor n=1 Tax=Streptomyces reniochalinae TaxID=2250578 RepID=A0A367EX36_9ACTN|nr:transcriptional repressor [Streptomyces reniochalinae]RCG22202.1 transcriptional repressor [Streptomyces reniochalinae]